MVKSLQFSYGEIKRYMTVKLISFPSSRIIFIKLAVVSQFILGKELSSSYSKS